MASLNNKSRGQEVSVFVSIDTGGGGVVQAGSFTDVLDFDVKPMIDHQELHFLGETAAQFDLQINGYEFTFNLNEEDNSAVDNLLMPLVDRLDRGDQLPTVNLTVITKYRGAPGPASTSVRVLSDCKVKLDDLIAGGRKDFTKIAISGRCRKMESRAG